MPSTDRATLWSVTINNPSPHDEEYIALARQRGWKVEGQLEKGENGTPHYQLAVRTPQVRFSQVKKAFPRAHIEVARNQVALEAYVHKTDTRVSALPESSSMYPSMSKFWEKIFDHFDTNDKDGWDYVCDSSVAFYDSDKQVQFLKDPLGFFDEACSALIRDGYHIESMAVNPSVRSAFKKFAPDLMFRVLNIRRQTDRQTVQEVVVPMVHNHGVSEEDDEEGTEDESSGSSSWASDCSPF